MFMQDKYWDYQQKLLSYSTLRKYCIAFEEKRLSQKLTKKAIFLHFHRYNNSVINFPTTGLAHSSKSGSRNWSWLPGAPGETNSVIVLDIFFPLALRLSRSNSLIPWGNSLREPNSQRSPSKSIFDQQVWPAGVDCGVAYDCRARKTRRPGFDQNIPEVAALLCANFCKKSPIWIAISFLLLAGYSTGCEVYSWTFHLICMHCARARVQIVHNYSQFSDGLSQEFQSPAKIHSLTSWRSNVVGGRTIVHRQAFMFSIRVALCPLCVASLNALLYKLKSILWQEKRLNESSIPVKYTAVPN